MIAAAALLVYAAVLGFSGARLLARGDWSDRAPRLGIVVWQAATASVLAAAVLAGLTLAIPGVRAAHSIAELFDACEMIMRAHHGMWGTPAIAGLASAAGVALWTLGHCVHALATTARRRRAHVDSLAMVARRRPGLDALVIDHDQPVAYCVPGRRHSVVLSTGALDLLDDDQLSAVIAHERAHLEGRHDLAANIAVAIARAFPVIPLFRQARDEIARLVEMAADDSATRHHDRHTVAAALVTVAGGRTPAASLGAGGSTALARVKRLLGPHRPLPLAARAGGVLGISLLVLLPLELAANPAIVALLTHRCHLT